MDLKARGLLALDGEVEQCVKRGNKCRISSPSGEIVCIVRLDSLW